MTTKYIEINRAIETALLLLEEGEDEQTLAYNAALVAFIKNMENAPAADVVEVVRCKDCKHYKTMFCKMDIWHKDITLYRADENDFCSYGERKDG